MNTTHPFAPEEVMAFLDGEVSATDAQAISAHLEHCVECTSVAEQFRNTSQSLSRWSVSAVPAMLEQAVRDLADKTRLGVKTGKPVLFGRTSVWTRMQWAIGLGSAVATILIFGAVSTSNRKSVSQHYSVDFARVNAGQPSERVQVWSGPGGLDKLTNQPVSERESKVFSNQIPPPASPHIGKLPSGELGAAVGSGLPVNGRFGGLGKLVTQSSPGAVADANGLFHGLGDHAQNSFTTNGLPGPMIARTVSLSVVVTDFAASRSSLDAILARHHGYSAQLNIATPENAPRSIQASLRVPATELSSAVADLKTLGRVENESQSGEEVTEPHTNLVARLKISRETERRFRAILEQRTGNVVDVLQVEEGIARVRGDIERMEAEQIALEHRVDFTAVELQLNEEYKAQLNPAAPSVSIRVHNSFVAGYHNASETVLGILLFFAEYGLTLLLWLVILVLPAILVRRRYRKALATV
jgi:hypothetical protein